MVGLCDGLVEGAELGVPLGVWGGEITREIASQSPTARRMMVSTQACTILHPLTVVGFCDGLVDGAELGLPLGVWKTEWVRSGQAIVG